MSTLNKATFPVNQLSHSLFVHIVYLVSYFLNRWLGAVVEFSQQVRDLNLTRFSLMPWVEEARFPLILRAHVLSPPVFPIGGLKRSLQNSLPFSHFRGIRNKSSLIIVVFSYNCMTLNMLM